MKRPFLEERHVQVYRGAESPPVLLLVRLISPPMWHTNSNKLCILKKTFHILVSEQHDFLFTCCESPFRAVRLTRMMTSPTLIRPLSAAGWPGNSFLIRTMLEPRGSFGTFSSRLKLNPNPEVFFSRRTSKTLSVRTKTGRSDQLNVVYLMHALVHVISLLNYCGQKA